MSEKFSDHFKTEHDARRMIQDATLGAERDAEVAFVDDMDEKFKKWGMDGYLSKKQFEWLDSLASK